MPKQGSAEADRAANFVLDSRVGRHVMLIEINRPEVRNAINLAVATRMHELVIESEADPSVRAVVVTGAGSMFCAGGDLKEIAGGRDIRLQPPGGFAGLVETVRTKPWIAAVNGSAYGGGMEIILACDLAVMAEHAELALPEVRHGLVALAGGAIRLPERLPLAIATELLITGAPMPARRAFEFGLINRLAPADSVLEEALALALLIANNSPNSVRESLALLKAGPTANEQNLWRLNQLTRNRIVNAPDFKEGPLAFKEKRTPQWGDS